MARILAYRGPVFTLAYARERNGTSPGAEFFDKLNSLNKAKLEFIFRLMAETGKCANPEKVGDLKEGLYEFKSFQIRMPFAYAKKERGLILITHGFYKKTPKTPASEIDRAWRILKEDQQTEGLIQFKKPK